MDKGVPLEGVRGLLRQDDAEASQSLAEQQGCACGKMPTAGAGASDEHIRYSATRICCKLCFMGRGCSRSGCHEMMAVWWRELWRRGLAWTWRYACVQEASNRGDGSAAALGWPDLSTVCGGCRALNRCNMCVGMWVQELGRGRAVVHGAAAQRLPHCRGTSLCRGGGLGGISAAGVLQGVQRL